MFSPLMNIMMQYGESVLLGIIAAFISKVYFTAKMQGEIRGYQNDILKSYAKINELEAQNEQLEKRLKNRQITFSKELVFLN